MRRSSEGLTSSSLAASLACVLLAAACGGQGESGGESSRVPSALDEAPTGTLALAARFNVCPVIDGLDALPAEVRVGGSLAVVGAAHDPDATSPEMLRGRWTVSAGILQNPTMSGGTFLCTVPGTASINWEVRDGDASPGCPATASLNVNCTTP